MPEGFTSAQSEAAAIVLGAAASEGNVEAALAALLKELGARDTVVRETVAGVQPDLRCPTARVLFELKRPGRAGDPHEPGTGGSGDESAYQQIERYIRAIQADERERLDLSGATRMPWLGVVTDGESWHAWLWPAHGGRGEEFLRTRRFRAGNEVELLAWLHRVVHRREGKPAVPSEPYTAVFEPYLARLRALANMTTQQAGAAAARARDTQRALWYDMLKGSGMVPAESDAAELFVQHTFLVAVARAVVDTLNGGSAGYRAADAQTVAQTGGTVDGGSLKSTPERAERVLGDGFVSWATLTEEGRQWGIDLFDAADGFDWRAQPRDVLRTLYEAVINPIHRKSFGEYYTPDWLAEFVVERVCDADWCAAAVSAARRADGPPTGVGVLDPACGSGTFLFHAARRICQFAGDWTPQQQADIAARLVWGIDIHPVAVEIARATLLRALPAVPSQGADGLRIHQGDSLAAAGQQALGTAHAKLTEVISEEGDGVWGWFMGNHLSTAMLAETKIDRIVANPPWVRMSEIQVQDRRESFERMIRGAGLYAKGASRSATGAAGSFDIAALFVIRCEDLYLSAGPNASGWVVNRASLTADNWSRLRAARTDARTCDLSRMRPPPFSGAASAVWFTGGAGDARRLVLTVAEGRQMKRGEPYSSVCGKIVESDATVARPAAPSGYTSDGSGSEPRSGANLRPHCLVVVEQRSRAAHGFAGVTTRESAQPPWKNVGVLTGDVRESWIRDAVFSQNLLVACFTSTLTACVVPTTTAGTLDADPDGDFWNAAQTRYRDFKGRGATTPDTLVGMLDYQGRLAAQLAATSPWTVVYNKSGSHLRAARAQERLILNDTCYWIGARGASEAAYLVAVLNADAMQEAYRAARKSDRDFVTHFWYQVPIPRYDGGDVLHQRLARLGERLEQVAATVRDRPDLAGAGQVKACTQIREALREDGAAGRLDEAVRELLPEHATG